MTIQIQNDNPKFNSKSKMTIQNSSPKANPPRAEKLEISPKIIVANWKMNPASLEEAEDLLGSILKTKSYKLKANLVICPPFIYLKPLLNLLKTKSSKLKAKLGAQDCFWENQGAYTGEISPLMLKNLGVEYVIVGHSKRRNYLGETDEMIAKKIKSVFENELTPVLCVGETLEQKKMGIQKKIIEKQLEQDLKYLKAKSSKLKANLVIAYEPIWAIGTGNYCQSEEALEIIKFIKQTLNSSARGGSALGGKSYILNSRVIYGGSVDSKNIAEYLKYPEINGVLVGGASLKIKEFKEIINEVSKSAKIKSAPK